MRRVFIMTATGIAFVLSALLAEPEAEISRGEEMAGGRAVDPAVTAAADATMRRKPNAGEVKEPAPFPATDDEKASLRTMAVLVSAALKPARSLNDLLDGLRSAKQVPYVVTDTNAFTGEMNVVRTRSPLPGTRYFHAQFFTDEDNRRFVQHMSFEYKPGPQAMNDAQAAVQSAFSGLGRPELQREDFVQWRMHGGYVLWIKRMNQEDLKDDPFNAYTPADAGTIRVAVELDPHG